MENLTDARADLCEHLDGHDSADRDGASDADRAMFLWHLKA